MPGETPGHFARRAENALPGFSAQVGQITELYNELAYFGSGTSRQDHADAMKLFIRAVKRFRPDRRRGLVGDSVSL
ncbi:MAG: DUF4129 domain-containing protein [Halioglobus sp.]